MNIYIYKYIYIYIYALLCRIKYARHVQLYAIKKNANLNICNYVHSNMQEYVVPNMQVISINMQIRNIYLIYATVVPSTHISFTDFQ